MRSSSHNGAFARMVSYPVNSDAPSRSDHRVRHHVLVDDIQREGERGEGDRRGDVEGEDALASVQPRGVPAPVRVRRAPALADL